MAALAGPLAAGQGSAADPVLSMTPLVLGVAHQPIPVLGSDGRYHVVYELEVTNFTTHAATIQKTEVLHGDDVVQSLDLDQVAARLAVKERSSPAGSPLLEAKEFGLLYLHVTFDRKKDIPDRLTHRLTVALAGRPEGFTQSGGEIRVSPPTDLVFAHPP